MKKSILTVLLAVATIVSSAATMTLSVAKTKGHTATVEYWSSTGDHGIIILEPKEEFKLVIDDDAHYTFYVESKDRSKFFYLDTHVKWIGMNITLKLNKGDTMMYGHGYDLHYGYVTKAKLDWIEEYFPTYRSTTE